MLISLFEWRKANFCFFFSEQLNHLPLNNLSEKLNSFVNYLCTLYSVHIEHYFLFYCLYILTCTFFVHFASIEGEHINISIKVAFNANSILLIYLSLFFYFIAATKFSLARVSMDNTTTEQIRITMRSIYIQSERDKWLNMDS